jgi:hypothetical protein
MNKWKKKKSSRSEHCRRGLSRRGLPWIRYRDPYAGPAGGRGCQVGELLYPAHLHTFAEPTPYWQVGMGQTLGAGCPSPTFTPLLDFPSGTTFCWDLGNTPVMGSFCLQLAVRSLVSPLPSQALNFHIFSTEWIWFALSLSPFLSCSRTCTFHKCGGDIWSSLCWRNMAAPDIYFK